jgi:hypothetical protein
MIKGYQYYVDSYKNDTINPNMELGTKSFPFRSLDDVFREIFNSEKIFTKTINVFVKHGSNITIHSQ